MVNDMVNDLSRYSAPAIQKNLLNAVCGQQENEILINVITRMKWMKISVISWFSI